MGNRFSKEEEKRIENRLVFENARRVVFSSAACTILVPILMLVTWFFAKTGASDFIRTLIIFEVFSVASLILSFMQYVSKEVNSCRTVYRCFWMIFELFAFSIMYSNASNGGSMTFYPILLSAILMIPLMNLKEITYYMVVQLAFTTFFCIRFPATAFDFYNIIISNSVLFVLSRFNLKRVSENFMLLERMTDVKDSTTRDRSTGLLNRKGLDKVVSDSIITCIKMHKRISVLLIDIDDLTQYNASFGTECGNDCIKTVSGIIRQVVLRNTDVICHLNGGRFLVYMDNGDDMAPLELAEKVRHVIEDKRIPHGRRAGNAFVTVSIGVASCIPKSERDFVEIFDEAEDALLDAKAGGKNITIYDSVMYGRKRRSM